MLTIIVLLVIVGIVLYLVNTYIPMDAKIKTIINIVVVLLVILWLLQQFEIIGNFGHIVIR